MLVKFHCPIGNIASISSFSLFSFLLYWPDFPFFVVYSQQTFDSQSKCFRYHYESFAFSPISRPYPSHTCLVLHVLGAHPPTLRLTPKFPPRHHQFLREHLRKSRIKGLLPKFPFITFTIHEPNFPFLRAFSATQILCPGHPTTTHI